jgi:hypothetical protein
MIIMLMIGNGSRSDNCPGEDDNESQDYRKEAT